MTSSRRSQSLSLPLLGATTTVGFSWLLWRALHKGRAVPSIQSKNHKSRPESQEATRGEEGESRDDDGGHPEASELDTSQSSRFDEDEMKQLWTDTGDVDLKNLKQLIHRKQGLLRPRPPRSASKLSLFSHLISRLEQTIEENRRIQAKLSQLKNPAVDNESVTKTEAERSLPPAVGNTPSNATTTTTNNNNNTSVCMVVQRFRGATLFINEDHIVRVGAATCSFGDEDETEQPNNQFCGMLVYVSFAKGATQSMVQAAAKIVVNLPILTMGAWGDGVSKTMNVLDLATQQQEAASLVIVPQANLICKVKSQGKSIQYHSQIDKREGKEMYQYFVNCIRGLVLEHQCKTRNEALPDWYQKSQFAQTGSSPQRTSPSVPPHDLFRDVTLYSSWDDNGIPMADAENQPITKSAQKKLRKAQAAHKVRHLKYMQDASRKDDEQRDQSPDETPASISQKQEGTLSENWDTAVDPSFVNIVAGTFGKRQSLEFIADMGPFCHVVQI